MATMKKRKSKFRYVVEAKVFYGFPWRVYSKHHTKRDALETKDSVNTIAPGAKVRIRKLH